MTKAQIIEQIIAQKNLEKPNVAFEALMETIKQNMVKSENIYLREFWQTYTADYVAHMISGGSGAPRRRC